MSSIYLIIVILVLLAVIFGGYFSNLNGYMIVYIIFSLFVLGGGVSKFIQAGQSITAVLFGIGAFAVLVTFGLKWFSKGSVFSETPVSWPPTINTCPDYLVNYPRQAQDGTTQNTCIDLIGVSKNGSLKVFPKDGAVPTSDDYYFSLITKSSDPVAKNQELCQRAITAGLTWEGITNGESCISPSGPVAPGGGGNGSGGCPA
jgi:hypothetical protein